jgi:hypothetical protein
MRYENNNAKGQLGHALSFGKRSLLLADAVAGFDAQSFQPCARR